MKWSWFKFMRLGNTRMPVVRPAARRTRSTRLLVEALEARTVPTTLTVTSGADSGAGTLRAEVLAANNGDKIIFSSSVTSVDLTSGPITIGKNITIQGPSGHENISGGFFFVGSNHRIFNISAGKTVTLTNLDLYGGVVFGVSGSNAGYGGAIYNAGHLTLKNDVLQENFAIGENDLSSANNGINGYGGGIFNAGTGTLILNGATIESNAAYGGRGTNAHSGGAGGKGAGGGIFNAGGVITINGATAVGENTAYGGHGGSGSGSGAGGTGGAGEGGGLWNTSYGSVTINAGTFEDNLAHGGKGGYGGISFSGHGGNGGQGGSGYGGAIGQFSGTVTAVNAVSFSDNRAIGGEGGHAGFSGSPGGVGAYGGFGGDGQGGAVWLGSVPGLNVFTMVDGGSFSGNGAYGGNGGTGGFSAGGGNYGGFGGTGGTGAGGAVFVAPGSVANLSGTTSVLSFTGNTAQGGVGGHGGQGGSGAYGGGGGDGGSAYGGALFSYGGTIAMDSALLSHNSALGGAPGYGGFSFSHGFYGGQGDGRGVFGGAIGLSSAPGYGGSASLTHLSMTSNSARATTGGDAYGGGLWAYGSGELDLSESIINHNLAQGGTGKTGLASGVGGTGPTGGYGGFGGAAFGGGFAFSEFHGAANVTDNTIENNKAKGGNGGVGGFGATQGGHGGHGGNGYGGGLFSGSSTVTFSENTFVSNAAYGGRGGKGGTVAPAPGHFAGEGGTGGSAYGGGVAVTSGTVQLTNNTIASNLAQGAAQGQSGSGTFTGPFGGNAYGGGVFASGGTVTLLNDTVAGASASVTNVTTGGNAAYGGGFFADGYGGGLASIFGNHLTLQNTIVANNFTFFFGPDIFGPITGNNHNIIGNTSGSSGYGGTDFTNVDPQLNNLAYNGGPNDLGAGQTGQLKTMLPIFGPAIDNGNNTGAPAVDERGFTRPDGSGAPFVDIGAVETQNESFTILSGTPQSKQVSNPALAPTPAQTFAPLVVVLTENGVGVSGVIVSYATPTPQTGGGAVASAVLNGTLGSPIDATTGANGHASVTARTNKVAGTYAVTPTIGSTGEGTTSGTDHFALTNTAGPVTQIVLINTFSGGGGTQAHPDKGMHGASGFFIEVELKDAFGNGVSGAAVTFTAPSQSGPSALFTPGNVGTTVVTTNASGEVTVDFKRNSLKGTYQIKVTTANGTPPPATLTKSIFEQNT
jgi:hypothetical protein